MRSRWKIPGAIAIAIAVTAVAYFAVNHGRAPSVDADELVGQAARALQHTPVKGTLVTTVRTPEGVETELRAEVHRGDRRFVIRYLSGPAEGMQVHRQRGAVWVEGREEERGPRRTDIGERELQADLLRRNWDFSAIGTRRVAGRTTTLVRGTGPGGTLTLAVDRETGFPLQMSRRGPKGEWISETTWTSADFSVEPPPRIDPPERVEDRRRTPTTLEDARAAVEFTVLEPTWVPEGWELEEWYLHDRPHRPAGAMVEARYTDGLRPLAILQRMAVRPDPDAERPERDAERRERREERDRLRPDGEGRPDREERHETQQRPDRPDGPVQRDRFGQGETGPRHLRGIGGDASRRVIDETVVIVIGPVSEEQRERILDGMKKPL